MHCKNCGNQVNSSDIACLSCGCDFKKGNKHCNKCGVETNPDQIICIKCGNSLTKHEKLVEGKSNAIIAYITLIGFIFALKNHNILKTKLSAFHLRQALGILLTDLFLVIICAILCASALDHREYKIAIIILYIFFIIHVIISICWIIGLFNAIKGELKPIPIFGELYEKWFGKMFEEDYSWDEQIIEIKNQFTKYINKFKRRN